MYATVLLQLPRQFHFLHTFHSVYTLLAFARLRISFCRSRNNAKENPGLFSKTGGGEGGGGAKEQTHKVNVKRKRRRIRMQAKKIKNQGN